MLASFRFYAELRDFLPRDDRLAGGAFSRAFEPHQTVKDIIESLGVPHTEVDLILVNGRTTSFSQRLSDGDEVSLFPRFRSLTPTSPATTGPAPKYQGKFVLDLTLGALVSPLRLFGLDVLWWREASGSETDPSGLIALTEERTLLTRNRRLLMRRAIKHGAFVREGSPLDQVVDILDRFQLLEQIELFSRCLACGGRLIKVTKDEVDARLEPKTRRYFDDFSRCGACGRVYWKGSHFDRLHATAEAVMARLTQCRGGAR